MTVQSHLYAGFQYAGALLSIGVQRELQREIFKRLTISSVLVVGAGYGEELNQILADECVRRRDLKISVVDPVDVREKLACQANIGCLLSNVHFQQLDLLNSENVKGFGTFDCVQCGFVLHDVPSDEKDTALSVLARAVRPGGYVIISEIFTLIAQTPSETAVIYDYFIWEANEALRRGALSNDEFQAFMGDGEEAGLTLTRAEAVRGERDFFDTVDALVERGSRAGLQVIERFSNPKNEHLFVLLFQRAPGAMDVP